MLPYRTICISLNIQPLEVEKSIHNREGPNTEIEGTVLNNP